MVVSGFINKRVGNHWVGWNGLLHLASLIGK